MADYQFPKDFVFGWSQSGFQSEMGFAGSEDRSSDWYLWVHDIDNIYTGLVSGDFPDDGPGYWDNFKVFHEAARGLHLKIARIGVEWSRLFPVRPPKITEKPLQAYDAGEIKMLIDELDRHVDREALNHYVTIFNDLREKGIMIIVNLYHWSMPAWIHDPLKIRGGEATDKLGWLASDIADQFAIFAAYMAYKMNDFAVGFSTMNEPNVLYKNGFQNLKSGFPPSILSARYAMQARKNILKAHSLAYDLMKTVTDKPIGLIYSNTSFTPYDSEKDTKAVEKANFEEKWSFFDLIINGDRELGISGRKLDWIGINYYSRTVVREDEHGFQRVLGFGQAGEKNAVSADSRPNSDFGWEFYPEGLEDVIMRYWNRYHLPMYITENGIADGADYQRPYYLVSHLVSVHNSIKQGADVRGYLHWSLVDNYEWSSGFKQKFGLIGFDDDKKLQWRPSALLYGEIARMDAIPEKFSHLNSIPPIQALRK